MTANLTAAVKRTTIVGASAVTALNCQGLRMVVLQSQGSEVGMIGLMEIRSADPPLSKTDWSPRLRHDETILVIPTENMRTLHEKMQAAGVCIVAPPVRVEVANRPEIHEMMVRDPDGVVVNLTQRGPLR